MGVDSLFEGAYVTCAHDSTSPYGRMVLSHKTLEEAKEHIQFQKETMKSKARWSILHVIALEWIPCENTLP